MTMLISTADVNNCSEHSNDNFIFSDMAFTDETEAIAIEQGKGYCWPRMYF